VQSSLRNLFLRFVLTIGASLLFWMLVTVSDDLFTPSGEFSPLYPFTIGDVDYLIGGVSVLVGSVILMMIVSMLYAHRSLVFGVAVLMTLALFFITIDFTITYVMHIIAWLANFDPPANLPRNREMISRFQRFGYLGAVSIIGIAPAFALRGTIRDTPRRRFRRVLRRKRKQRGSND
jgi:hypothetical protein